MSDIDCVEQTVKNNNLSNNATNKLTNHLETIN